MSADVQIDDSGVITISGDIDNLYLSGGVATGLGLSEATTNGTSLKSSALTYVSTSITTNQTTLGALGVTGNVNLTIQLAGTTNAYTFNSSSTLQDVANAVTATGGSFTLSGNTIEISGVDSMQGTLLTSLGFAGTATGNTTTIQVNNLTYTTGGVATEASKFTDFGISIANKSFNVYTTDGSVLGSNLTLTADATVGDLLNKLNTLGVSAYLDTSGRINISNGYITGGLATALGISATSYETVVTEKTLVSTVMTASTSTTASLSTTLGSLGLSGTQEMTVVYNGKTYQYTFNTSSTLADVKAAVESAGGEFDLTDGYISAKYVELSGDLVTNLGISKQQGATEYVYQTVTTLSIQTITSLTTQTLENTTTEIVYSTIYNTVTIESVQTITTAVSTINTSASLIVTTSYVTDTSSYQTVVMGADGRFMKTVQQLLPPSTDPLSEIYSPQQVLENGYSSGNIWITSLTDWTDFVALCESALTFDGNIFLGCDLDLSSVYSPIDASFINGCFYGNGHTITGFTDTLFVNSGFYKIADLGIENVETASGCVFIENQLTTLTLQNVYFKDISFQYASTWSLIHWADYDLTLDYVNISGLDTGTATSSAWGIAAVVNGNLYADHVQGKYNLATHNGAPKTGLAYFVAGSITALNSYFEGVDFALTYQYSGATTNVTYTNITSNTAVPYYYAMSGGGTTIGSTTSSSTGGLTTLTYATTAVYTTQYVVTTEIAYKETVTTSLSTGKFISAPSTISASEAGGSVYEIGSIDDLKALDGKTIVAGAVSIIFTADLDLSTWTKQISFTTPNPNCSINIYGNGHVLSNQKAALFGTISTSASVSFTDLGFENVNISGDNSYQAGCIASCIYLRNSNTLAIDNCYIDNGTIGANAGNAGGFVGYLYGSGTVNFKDCSVSNLSINGAGNTGGFAGYCGVFSTFSNCIIKNLTHTTTSSKTGAFLGYAYYIQAIVNCYYDGTAAQGNPFGSITSYNTSAPNIIYTNGLDTLYRSTTSSSGTITITLAAIETIEDKLTIEKYVTSYITTTLSGTKTVTTTNTAPTNLGVSIVYSTTYITDTLTSTETETTMGLSISTSYTTTTITETTTNIQQLTNTVTTVSSSSFVYRSNQKTLGITTTDYSASDTKLSQLGISNGTVSIKNNSTGATSVFTVTSASTLSDFIATLELKGFDVKFENGRLTLSTTEDIVLTNGTSNLVTKLGLQTSTTYVTNKQNSTSNPLNNQSIKTITTSTTLGAFAETLADRILNINVNGIDYSKTFSASNTMQDVLNYLGSLGLTATLSGGTLKLSSADQEFTLSGSLSEKLLGDNPIITSGTRTTAWKATAPDQTYTNVVTATTTLKDLGFTAGGTLRVVMNGVQMSLGFNSNETVNDIIQSLSVYGISAGIQNGTFTASCTDSTFELSGELAQKLLGSSYTNITTTKVIGYETKKLTTDTTYTADETTKLSDLGVSAGYINVLKNGEITNSIAIDENTTVQQLLRALSAHGIAANISTDGKISLASIGDVTISDGTSDLVSVLGLEDTTYSCTYQGTTMVLKDNVNIATLDTLVSTYDTAYKTTAGAVYVQLTDQDGNSSNTVVNIDSDDTIADVIEKFEAIGLHTSFENGVFSCHYGLGEVTLTSQTSSLPELFGLTYQNLETWMQNSTPIQYLTDEIRYDSICNYADNSTSLYLLNVTEGEFTVGINGMNKRINIDSTDTISSLIAKISSATNGTVTASLTDDGKFILKAADGIELTIGTNTDTTNLVSVFNLEQNQTNTIYGQTSLYKVAASSKITQSGLFRLGNVTQGTFTIGNAEFTITADTTIESLINQINHSEDALASAYWDNINGKMVITSKSLGATYLNISSGTSNFTEIFGLTTNDGSGEKLATYNQKLGNNAILTINGTRIVSTSNTITSDISRIEGLTVNVKDITGNETVTITVERDNASIVDAVKETLEQYNSLIENLNNVLAIGGELHNDISLRSIRNEISQLVTAKGTNGTNQFRNLSAIGISTDAASSALTSDIYSLYLDEEKFLNALETSEEDVNNLLVGTVDAPGIFTKIESILESALSTNGYINSKNSSLNRQISSLDKKIQKSQSQLDAYKALLEKKFSNMETIYSTMQSSYNNLFSIM